MNQDQDLSSHKPLDADFAVPEAVTFEQAIALTKNLLTQMEAGLSATKIQAAVTALVSTKAGARGFFVTYLTDPRSPSSHPPAVIQALQSAPETVAELLVKNLAMSTAMILTHQGNQSPQMAADSAQVQARALGLIQQLPLPAIQVHLQKMQQSAANGKGDYQSFLERWGYDDQQRQTIQQVLAQVLPHGQSPNPG